MNYTRFPPQKVSLNKARAELHITWRNGDNSRISGDELRRFCACSECRARHVVGIRLVTESAVLEAIALMGRSALQAVFADGHDRGIYPWPYLYAIALGRAKEYLDE